MNAPEQLASTSPTLADCAFAWLAPPPPHEAAEALWLARCAARCRAAPDEAPGEAGLRRWQAQPPPADQRLVALGVTLALSLTEMLAVALACAAETEPMSARVLAWLQAPVGGARPSVGLVLRVAGLLGEPAPLASLVAGPARASGLLRIDDDNRPLPETTLSVPQPVVLALADPPWLHWPGLRFGLTHALLLPRSVREAATTRAQALAAGAAPALVVRSGHPREAQAAAAEIAVQMNARPLFIDGDVPPGLGPWLRLAGALPVLCLEPAPGERKRVAEIPGWSGPILVATGPDGSVELRGETVPGWRVPMPPADERAALWQAALGDAALAQRLGQQHRHGSGRIAELGRAARFEAQVSGLSAIAPSHVAAAARGAAAADLGAMAELMPDLIADDALVLPTALRAELDSLAARCLMRDSAAQGLGPALQARFRPGVRSLFVGPSGTGKSLAVGWLATHLGLPLYRVDLASVTSKYIGETEKNLAQLFARAEHAEVVLMFDEADALFGKRTDVKDSNDRFANAQTNYLLSRIESYEGIAILTSNSRSRFDSAFTRRLDAIVEFPLPTPVERRALWQAHLGDGHSLSAGDMNSLAVACELAGGHVRNVVVAAAAIARQAEAPIRMAQIVTALAAEYRKLGKQAPAGLG